MHSKEEVEQRWIQLQAKLQEKLGNTPVLEDVLFAIGVKEACMPPRIVTETERVNIIQMAECTVLVPARYYQLYWVEDSGWPHYTELQRLPKMTAEEKLIFLKPWIVMYAEKNRMM